MDKAEIQMQLDIIKKEIEAINGQIFKMIINKNKRTSGDNEIDVLIHNKDTLLQESKMLKEKLFFLKPPAMFNDLIDLRCDEFNSKRYIIYLHNTKIIVGDIDYRGYHTSDFFGDVGYNINARFAGNNYAYHALVLLSEKLNEDGIIDFWISTRKENLPSLKTIEKYGANLIKELDNEVLLFECKTRKNTKKDDQNISNTITK